MVVNTSVSKMKNFRIVDGLGIPFESLTISAPSSKLAAEEALSVEAGQAGDDNEDDTESFNEEECWFMDGGDGENALNDGAFSHYFKAVARLTSARPRSNSSRLRLNSACHQEDVELSCFLDSPHNSTDACEHFVSHDGSSSPLDIATSSPNTMRRIRRTKKSSLSVRESLLAEAWERKRELMLNEELANVKERASPELLGRSSSDCGKLVVGAQAATPSELRRSRTRSLTDHDFEELRGCIDLGFRFDQSSIPDLCDTLPALEVYCAVAQSLQESPSCMSLNSPVMQSSPARCSSPSQSPSWRISSPGDDPDDVKGRLRHWAQAVACNAKLCY